VTPRVTLVRAWWVTRRLRVETDHGAWTVDYRGYYLGSEAVFVDGKLAQRILNTTAFKMVTRFEFDVGPHRAALSLAFDRMWTIFFPRLRTLVVDLDDVEVYRDGHEVPRATLRDRD